MRRPDRLSFPARVALCRSEGTKRCYSIKIDDPSSGASIDLTLDAENFALAITSCLARAAATVTFPENLGRTREQKDVILWDDEVALVKAALRAWHRDDRQAMASTLERLVEELHFGWSADLSGYLRSQHQTWHVQGDGRQGIRVGLYRFHDRET